MPSFGNILNEQSGIDNNQTPVTNLSQINQSNNTSGIIGDLGKSLLGATTGGIGSIIGGLAGSLLQGISNSNQISQQQKLTAIQTSLKINKSYEGE